MLAMFAGCCSFNCQLPVTESESGQQNKGLDTKTDPPLCFSLFLAVPPCSPAPQPGNLLTAAARAQCGQARLS